jgi:hypothetical protein
VEPIPSWGIAAKHWFSSVSIQFQFVSVAWLVGLIQGSPGDACPPEANDAPSLVAFVPSLLFVLLFLPGLSELEFVTPSCICFVFF